MCGACVCVVRSQHRLFGGPVNRDDGGPHGLRPQQLLCVCVCVRVRVCFLCLFFCLRIFGCSQPISHAGGVFDLMMTSTYHVL